MELIHDRLLNNQFAPGIATYGIDGKDGKTGPTGTSFYFTSYSLENQNQNDECIVKINQNKVLSEFVDSTLEREYLIGDLILDAVGKIYKIIKRNGQFALDYVSTVIGIDQNEFFKTSGNNRLFLDPRFVSLDLIQGTSDNSMTLPTSSANAILRIANTKEDSKSGKFNLVQIQTKPAVGDPKYLNITFDKTTDSFVIETKSDILIDTDLVEVKSSSSRTTTSLGEYYKITPYDDPIGLVHLMLSSASWSHSGKTVTISDIDITHLNSLGLSVSFNVKVECVDSSNIVKSFIKTSDVVPDTDYSGHVSVSFEGNTNFNNVDLDSTNVNVSVIRGIEVFIPKS